jgi:general secretion pathway protein H
VRTRMYTAGTEDSREPKTANLLRDGSQQRIAAQVFAILEGVGISTGQRTSRTSRSLTLRARRKGFWSQAGFSLLELLVVLMLLALVTAVVAPSLGRSLATAKLKTSCREIAATIRLARSKAVREQQVYLLGFDLEKHEMELSGLNSSYRKSFRLPDGIHLVKASLLETNVEDEAKNPSFYFMPNGNGQSFQVSLRNPQGRVMRVIHNNLKGAPVVDEDDSSTRTSHSN